MFRRVITVKGWMISKVMGGQICGLKASRIRPRQSHEVSSGKVDSPHVERVWKKLGIFGETARGEPGDSPSASYGA